MRNLLAFFKRIRILLLFLLLEILALLMTFNKSTFHNAASYQFFMGISSRVMTVRSNIISFINLREENEQLVQENIRLRSKHKSSFILSDQRVFTKNDTLYRQQFEYLTANAIQYTTNYRDNYVTLDKGSDQGIEPGMGVFSPGGVVGIVEATSKNYCLVKSMLHSEVNISTQIKGKGVTGTSSWDGENYAFATLSDVPTHIKLKKGDTLVTSSFSSIFPAGIPVGYIDSYNTDATRAFYKIKFLIAADFGDLTTVYIVRNLIKDELEELEKLKKEPEDE